MEIYAHGENGRGYFLLEDLAAGRANAMFNWPDGEPHPDIELLRVLDNLKSYDVFNLRIKFREFNIDYEGNDYLKLSHQLEQELAVYMRQFTLPLIQTIFGDNDRELDSVGDIIGLLKNPDSEDARENLRILADRLQIGIGDIPEFLREFSDVYLAISYYKNYADQISVMNASLSEDFNSMEANFSWKADPQIARLCGEAKSKIRGLLMEVFRRLDIYEQETRDFWNDLNAVQFRNIQFLLRDSQTAIGGILCGLGVKLTRWQERFPKAENGAPAVRFEALQNELFPGLDDLAKLATTGTRSVEPRATAAA